MPDAIRTPNPVFSFTVIGPKKNEFYESELKTITRKYHNWGNGSIFELIENYNAKYILINNVALTQIHRYEKLSNVPYRRDSRCRVNCVFDETNEVKYFSKYYYPKISGQKRPVVYIMKNMFKNNLKISHLNNNKIVYLYCEDIKNTIMKLLKENPRYFQEKHEKLF
mgnify:CR=1 FL=1